MKHGDEYIYNAKEIAEHLYNFFINTSRNIIGTIPQVNSTFHQYLPNPIVQSMFIDPVDPYDIKTIINKLKPKTSSGFDDISCKLMKLSVNYITDPLAYIINLSLSSGIVPRQMKVAKVVPIFKSGDKYIFSNYRPVSLLPAFSKVLERAMYNKVITFLDINHVLYRHQYGFRSQHSTIHPIIHFLNDCAKANNKSTSEITLALFCDLSKAFDIIDHDILLYKLSLYGIRGIALDWFRDYLTDRKQYIQIKNDESSTCNVMYGVPQGSILGPLLFLIFINDICFSDDFNILSFAVDTTMYISSNSIDILSNEANTQMNALFTWFSANKLFLNAKQN